MNDTERIEKSFEALGLTPAQAKIAAAGRDPAHATGFDGVVETYKALGMSESAAKVAAIGRGSTEAEARKTFDEAVRDPGYANLDRRIERTQRLLAEASDAELAGRVKFRRPQRSLMTGELVQIAELASGDAA